MKIEPISAKAFFFIIRKAEIQFWLGRTTIGTAKKLLTANLDIRCKTVGKQSHNQTDDSGDFRNNFGL